LNCFACEKGSKIKCPLLDSPRCSLLPQAQSQSTRLPPWDVWRFSPNASLNCRNKLSISPDSVSKSCEDCPVWAASGRLKPLCLCVRIYCTHEIWKKLSISAGGFNKKLRRLSSVGSQSSLIRSIGGHRLKVASSFLM